MKNFLALSPWIAGISAVLYLISLRLSAALSDFLFTSVIIDLIGYCFMLAAVICAPFALARMMSLYGHHLRALRLPEWLSPQRWMPTVRASFARLGAGMARILNATSRGARKTGKAAVPAGAALVQSVPSGTGRSILRGMATLLLLLMQVIILIGGNIGIGIAGVLMQSPGPVSILLIIPALIWPLALFGVAAVQTRFGLWRLFDYSGRNLGRFARLLFKSSPFVAAFIIVSLCVVMGVDAWGWMIILAPIVAVQVIVYFFVIGGLVLLLKWLTTRGQTPPTDPPTMTPAPVSG